MRMYRAGRRSSSSVSRSTHSFLLAPRRPAPPRPWARNSLEPHGSALRGPTVKTGTDPECRDEIGRLRRLRHRGCDTLTLGHLLSAGLVGFARGLNDTPKIVGLFVGLGITSALQGTIAVAADDDRRWIDRCPPV